MTANATVYANRALSAGLIRSSARDAKVSSGDGDRIAVIELGAIRMTIDQLPAAELAAHIAGVRSFVTARCDVEDEGFVARIDAVEQVLGLAIEPDLDTAGQTAELILTLARYGQGFVFDGTRFRDGSGRVLAIRTARVDPGDGALAMPPDAERVLARAWVLSAVALRAFLEDEPGPQAAGLAARIGPWLRDRGLEPELEPEEQAMIAAPLGALTDEAISDAALCGEGLAVLGWALGVSELPDHATAVDAGAVATVLGFLADERPRVISPPRLRSQAELDWMARRLTGLHWRLRELWANHEPVDFRSFARNAWFGGFDLVGIAMIGDDLAVDGVPLVSAPRDRQKYCHSIAAERHQAIAWLRGVHKIYSRVDTAM